MKIKALLILAIFFPLISFDRISKVQAVTYLKGDEPRSFFNGIFHLTYHENTGGMLNLGSGLPDDIRTFVFTTLVGLALIAGTIYIIAKPMSKIHFIMGLLIISGGLGNLYDRIFNHGRVVDFMLLQLGPLHTGVFNIADVAIMAGMFGLLIFSGNWGKHPTK